MDSEEAIIRLRRGYEAFNRGDLEAVLAELAPEIEFQERAEAPDPRRGSGREEAIDAFRSLRDDFADYRLEPREFVVEGDHIIAEVWQSGRGRLSGVPVEGEIIHAWRVDENVRVVGLRAFSTLAEALAFVRGG